LHCGADSAVDAPQVERRQPWPNSSPSPPGVEVNGQTVLSVVDGSTIKKSALKYLSKSGIADPAP